jgi:hypothetical protein
MPAGVVAVIFAIGQPASASAPDAWQAFRDQVRSACQTQVPFLEQPVIHVEPFGTEHHGVALISGAEQAGGASEVRVCVYDKQAKTAEVSGPLPGVVLEAAAQAPARDR